MKRIFLIGALIASAGVFANERKEPSADLNQEVQKGQNEEVYTCCTATLYYFGEKCDSYTMCSDMPLYDNCQAAKTILLDRNPDAKKALTKSLSQN
ncbi:MULTISPECIES: hypothetical protein [unclassified Flavobacterium]|uniref:hypothetical protein n=1 Tax=unclassified Flavobacterium TaxID=196869 RepID=UPI001F1459D4|nr:MULTISPECIES: hypothetical protein [unclassified Flavobacterium]UMY67128.1 hypothetical protein MKO97_07045 [Flavobacterium sp. HJ-32-4]